MIYFINVPKQLCYSVATIRVASGINRQILLMAAVICRNAMILEVTAKSKLYM